MSSLPFGLAVVAICGQTAAAAVCSGGSGDGPECVASTPSTSLLQREHSNRQKSLEHQLLVEKDNSTPFGCQAQVPVSDFDMAAFSAGGWHLAYHQPTLFEFGMDQKCTKVDFAEKAKIGNGYTFEFFAQSYSGTMQQRSSFLGCGFVDSPGKLTIGTCDSAPDNVNFIVIHHEKGDEEFIVTVGADPVVPVMQPDGSIKCMHEQTSPDNNNFPLSVFTRKSGTMSDTALNRAKKIVSENGMIWDMVMMPTPQTDCDYSKPSDGNAKNSDMWAVLR